MSESAQKRVGLYLQHAALHYESKKRTALLSYMFVKYSLIFIDRLAGEIIRFVASVCVRVCVSPFVCGRCPV